MFYDPRRERLTKKQTKDVFDKAELLGIDVQTISETFNINPSTVYSWKNGKTRAPFDLENYVEHESIYRKSCLD